MRRGLARPGGVGTTASLVPVWRATGVPHDGTRGRAIAPGDCWAQSDVLPLVTLFWRANGATALTCGIMSTHDDIFLHEVRMAANEKEAYLALIAAQAPQIRALLDQGFDVVTNAFKAGAAPSGMKARTDREQVRRLQQEGSLQRLANETGPACKQEHFSANNPVQTRRAPGQRSVQTDQRSVRTACKQHSGPKDIANSTLVHLFSKKTGVG